MKAGPRETAQMEGSMEIKQKKRAEIADEFKWHLNDLVASDEAWKDGVADLQARAERLAGYAGKLTDGETLLACLNDCFAAFEIEGRLYAYANMKFHEDTNITKYQSMADLAQSTSVKISAAAAFIDPEILLIDEARLRGWIETVPGLKLYEHFIENLLRSKEHILSKELEELLAAAGEIGSAAENIYDMIHDTDMKFGNITDENGNTMEMTHGRFIRSLESRDRRVRKEAFDTYYAAFQKQKNTITAAYNASVKKDIFFAKSRKHETAMGAALFGNNIPQEVYTRLIETVHEFLPQMHRYIRLRKKALNVPELHYYDLYTPIVRQADETVPFACCAQFFIRFCMILPSNSLSANT